jgi:hypothetical protein
MSQHDLCEYVIASVLSTTARAWGHAPAGPALIDDTGPVATANAHGSGKFPESLFWMRLSNLAASSRPPAPRADRVSALGFSGP